MEATARTFYSLVEDFDNREEARRREEYYAKVKRLENRIAENEAILAKKDVAIAEKDAMIAKLTAQLEALKK